MINFKGKTSATVAVALIFTFSALRLFIYGETKQLASLELAGKHARRHTMLFARATALIGGFIPLCRLCIASDSLKNVNDWGINVKIVDQFKVEV
jgi:hypothetical protein